MIKKFESALIVAESGEININNVEATLKKVLGFSQENCFAQLVQLKFLVSLEQVFSAAEQTLSAFELRQNFSKKPELEFLARVFATRKITEVLKKIGLKEGKNLVVLIMVSDLEKNKGKNRKGLLKNFRKLKKEIGFVEKKDLLEKNLKKNFKKIQEFYCVSEAELKALEDFKKEKALKQLVLERVALVDL